MSRILGLAIVALTCAGGVAVSAQTPADRQRAQIQNRLGWEAMRAEDWAEAARLFRRAIETDPSFEYPYYGLGRAELARRQYQAAVDALEKCRDLYRAQAGRQFTNAHEAQRHRQDRIVEIDEQIRQAQSMPQTIQVQELLRQLQNLKRDVQLRMERGVNISIENTVPAFVTLSLGSAYFRAGKLADAEREYRATIASDPKSGEAHNNLAVVFLETGRYAAAEESVKAAKKAGFRVHPDLEKEIRDRKKAGS